jgi:hypothetical protein
MKRVLKPPGSVLLKLRYDGPLSRIALEFNLRRYSAAEAADADIEQRIDDAFMQVPENSSGGADAKERRCRLTLSNLC